MTDNTVNINIGFSENDDRHACTAVRLGDWIVFKCEKCPGYERKINWKTGGMVIHRGNSTASHYGMHMPVLSNTTAQNPN